MGYVDIQEINAEREAKARRVQDAQQAEKRAELAERDERCRGSLFMDPRRAWLDSEVKTDLDRHKGHLGHVGPHKLARLQNEAWASLAPILAESPNMPLAQFKEIVVGMQRPKLTDAGVDARADMLVNSRTAIYETAADRKAALAGVNAELAKSKPVLNELLKTTGAGNSLPLARSLIEEAAQRRDDHARSPTAGRWLKVARAAERGSPRAADGGPTFPFVGRSLW